MDQPTLDSPKTSSIDTIDLPSGPPETPPKPITTTDLSDSPDVPIINPTSESPDLHSNATTNFHPFPKLPPELRLKVWKYAIPVLPSRIISLQPSHLDIPGPLQACRESRDEAKKIFTTLKSRQPTFPFTIFINFEEDTIYLNRKFTNPAKDCYPSAIHGAIHFYQDVLNEVRVLAMNVKDMNDLTTAYRGGKWDLSVLLKEHCPKLQRIYLVLDGPSHRNVKAKIDFRRLVLQYGRDEVDMNEFGRRHRKLLQVLASLFQINQEEEGLWKGLVISLVTLDHTKQLPIKEGEKENRDGEGGEDAYGLCDWKSDVLESRAVGASGLISDPGT